MQLEVVHHRLDATSVKVTAQHIILGSHTGSAVIEVTNTHKDKVPATYLRKQTLTNAERYATEELQDLERRVLSAKAKRSALESELFEQLNATRGL